MKKVLTIAGSDCSGGAGIQADLKTIMAHGMYGMSVLTAVTVQNTMGVKALYPVPADIILAQIRAVAEDIFPDAVKIGMQNSIEAVHAVADGIGECLKREGCPIVIDTVMLSTSGKRLLEKGALSVYCERLLPMADVITPNLPELFCLYHYVQEKRGKVSDSDVDMEEKICHMAETLEDYFDTAVFAKGGHRSDGAEDILFASGKRWHYPSARIDNPNTHGTGCTLSTALACRLAEKKELPEAAKEAKLYTLSCIKKGMDLGRGNGPLCHLI